MFVRDGLTDAVEHARTSSAEGMSFVMSQRNEAASLILLLNYLKTSLTAF